MLLLPLIIGDCEFVKIGIGSTGQQPNKSVADVLFSFKDYLRFIVVSFLPS